MKKLAFGLILSLIASTASAGLDTVLKCTPVKGGASFLKQLVLQKRANNQLALSIQSVYGDNLHEIPILKIIEDGSSDYKKLVVAQKPGYTMSLVYFSSQKVERAVLIHEGPNAPQPKDFGAVVEFLDCN